MNKKAFSLVELIVGIIISMILMTGVGVLVSGGITNIVMQDKIIQNTGDFREFSKDSLDLFSRINTSLEPIGLTSTIALLKVNKNYNNIGVSYIGEVEKDGFYCSGTDVDSTITNHILIKNFLPFEEIGEDIFNDFSKTLYSNSNGFKAFYKSHIVKYNSDIIVGKNGVFGYKLGDYGTGTFLNNPTGLAYDSAKKMLYISDTGNNRILVYNNDNSSSDYKKIYQILGEKDGLDEPTGLALSGSSVLYISNSGKGEILEYSSKSSIDKKLHLDFNIDKDINNLRNFSVEIFSGVTDITKPDNSSQFILNGISKKSHDYLTGSNNKLTYWITDFSNNFSTQSNQICTNNYTNYYVSSNEIIKEEITDCNSFTGTIKKYKSSSYQNISSGSNVKISTSVDFDGSYFSKYQAYYLKLTLSGATDYYQKYFPFFINGDNDLITREDNTLKVISSNFKYPTGISYNNSLKKITVNDFWDRKEYTINLDGSGKSVSKSLTTFDYSNIPEDKRNDYFLNTPIDNLTINYDSIKKYLNLNLTYYKQYNCYNLDEQIKRSLILSKSYK